MSKKVGKVYTTRDIAVRYAKALKKGETIKDICESLAFISFGNTEHRSIKDVNKIDSIDYFFGKVNCITVHFPSDASPFIAVTEVL